MADARKHYSEIVVNHAINQRNLGTMDGADGWARITGPCGDTLEMWLKIRSDIITESTFMTDGCATTIAAGSMVTELARGKSVKDALGIGQPEVLNALGGLPEESRHCALLAANTLEEAIKDYLTFKDAPWKRAYRKY